MVSIIKYAIKNEYDLDRLKDVWTPLEAGEEMTTFQTLEWHRLLIKEWEGWQLHALYSEVYVYAAFEGRKPVMLFPAIVYTMTTKTKWFGSKKGVYLLGQGSYSDYMTPIYRSFSAEAFEAICSAIRREFPGYPICLNSVRADSQLAAYLSEKGVRREVFTVALAVKRKASVEEYKASLTKKTRANLRKAMNRIERDGLDFQLEIRGPIHDQALLDQMVGIHVARILTKNTKHEGVLHVLSSYVRKAYRKYRDLNNNIIAMCMQENPHSVVILVRINGKLVGYQYGLREEHVLRLLQTCFDEEYKFYSPVFRAGYDFICQSYEDESLWEIDFTRGDEEFKYRLGGEELELYEFSL